MSPAKKNSGQDERCASSDTNARYLYLYQVVHDSKRDSVVKTATIRLVIDPQLITSFGSFVFRKPEGPPKPGEDITGQGVGFAQEVSDPKINMGTPFILPISTDHPATTTREYRDPSPYYVAPKRFSTARILLDNKVKAVADDPSGAAENPGRAPEEVMMLNSAVFDGPPRIRYEATRALDAGFAPGYAAAYPGAIGAVGYSGVGFGVSPY